MAAAEDVQKQENQDPPKKRGIGKKGLLFIVLLCLLGTLTGLHFAGVWDARPLLYRVVPSLPFVGPKLAQALNVPAEYSLTVEERRALELQKRQEMLHEFEENLKKERGILTHLSGDLEIERKNIEEQKKALEASLAQAEKEEPKTDDLTEENIKDLLKVYGEMSARNAAAIMEKLPAQLSVTLLSRMPQDQAAKILGKMEPAKAAFLTKGLAQKTDS